MEALNIDEEYFKSEEFQDLLERYEASINAGSTPFMDADDLVDKIGRAHV